MKEISLSEAKKLDLRGKTCPLPVVETRKVLQSEPGIERLEVLLSSSTSCENVTRTARSLGCKAESKEHPGGEFLVVIEPPAGGAAAADGSTGPSGTPFLPEMTCALQEPRVVLLLATDVLGEGNDELGHILIRGFIKALPETNPQPHTIMLMNNGVKLTTEGSEVIEDLERLAGSGVEILSCGTCLDFHGLREKLKVGRVTNMLESATLLMSADRVVRV